MSPSPFSLGNLAAADTSGENGTAGNSVFNKPPPPILIGGLLALFLSGVVFMQVVLYFQVYQIDRPRTKIIVLVIWILDIVHSALVCTANWGNLVVDYGAFGATLDHIQWSIALTIALTAVTTLIVHSFLIHRIWMLSHKNWYITIPLLSLALLRVGSALVTTAEMLRLKSYNLFIDRFNYIFTLGLTTSASLDIIITCVLCFYIRKGRAGFARVNHMIDTLTLYTVENGMLTCIATSLSLFFWLFLRQNFVFLGMHLVINKLYANTFLASLNARKSLVNRVQGSGHADRYPLPVMLPNAPVSPRNFSRGHDISTTAKPLQVAIDVERTIQHDDLSNVGSSRPTSRLDLDSLRKSGSDTLSTDGVKTEGQ